MTTLRHRKNRIPFPLQRVLSLSLLGICLGVAGCIGFKTVNVPIEQHDPAYGYRPQMPEILPRPRRHQHVPRLLGWWGENFS